jgi:para-nitrobenzyl esterase
MEIPFMLYSYDRVRTFVSEGPGPAHMAAQIGGAWAAFARTGRPDHPGIPHWPAWDAQQRPVG